MPGIALYIDVKGISREKFQSGLQRMLFDNRFKANIYLLSQFIGVGSVAYDEYPIAEFTAEKRTLILEGSVYRFDVAEFLNDDDSRWLNSIDGDYLLIRISPDGNSVSITNDYLARLPLYIYQDDSKFIAAREIKFIEAIMGPMELDPIACAETMCLDATLGNRTIYKNIEVLPPANQIEISIASGDLKVCKSVYIEHNYEAIRETVRKPTVRDLVELFLESCKRRLEVGKPIPLLTLSGGMDSRGVAGGLFRLKQPFHGVTYIFEDEGRLDDGNVARMLMEHIGIAWKGYPTKRGERSFDEKVIGMKDGLHNVSVGFILKFYYEVLNDFGSGHDNWTGDGGDRCLVDVSGNIKPDNFDGALIEIHKRHNLASIDLIEDEFGILRGTVFERLASLLEQYPEKRYTDKLVHYTIMQRARRWSFEGEDRNRFFYNSVAPFFYRPFFDAAMSLPNEPKRGRKLYGKFLRELSPEICQIVYAGFGVPIDSFRFKIVSTVHASRILTRLNKIRKRQKKIDGLTYIQQLRLKTLEMVQERSQQFRVN